MPGTPQTVATVNVFDYLYDTAGKPIVGAAVRCVLNYNTATVNAPAVTIGPNQQSTTTDSTGWFSFALVPSASLAPTGTTYQIVTPFAAYDISVPSGPGPYQAPALIVGQPATLASPTTVLAGPLTVQNGPLTVQAGGANITGGETLAGGLTVSSGGASITGATTSSGALTVQAGGANITGGTSTDQMTVRGLAGAANQSRWVGSTTTVGPPIAGSFLKGDVVIDQNGLLWICTVAGTPGTWTSSANGLLHAEVFQTAVQSIPTGAAFTLVAYDTIEADGMGWYSTVNRQFTPAITGRFLVSAAVTWAAANGSQSQLAVFYNNALARNLTSPNASHIILSGTAVVRVTVASQPLDIRILQQSVGAVNTNPGATNMWAQYTYLGGL